MIIKDVIDARILVELGSKPSFAAVARQLGMPAATLSRRVAEMERTAGLRLFDRTTRAVMATESGELAIEHATRILAEAEAVQRSLEARRGTSAGRVRMSAPIILGQQLLGPIIAEFLATNPACDITLDLSNRRVDLVDERFDFAVRVGPPGDQDLIALSVGEATARLFQRAARAPGPVLSSPDQLEGRQVGLLRSQDVTRPILRLASSDGEEMFVKVHARLIALSPWLLAEVAMETDLLVVLPDMSADDLVHAGRLEPVLPGWHVVDAPVSIIYTSRQFMRPATRACIDFVASRLRLALKRPPRSVT